MKRALFSWSPVETCPYGWTVRAPRTVHVRPRRGESLYQLSFLLGKGYPRESSFPCTSRFAQGLEGQNLLVGIPGRPVQSPEAEEVQLRQGRGKH